MSENPKPVAVRATSSYSPLEVDEMLHALDLRARAYQGTPSPQIESLQRKANMMKRTIRRKQKERDAG